MNDKQLLGVCIFRVSRAHAHFDASLPGNEAFGPVLTLTPSRNAQIFRPVSDCYEYVTPVGVDETDKCMRQVSDKTKTFAASHLGKLNERNIGVGIIECMLPVLICLITKSAKTHNGELCSWRRAMIFSCDLRVMNVEGGDVPPPLESVGTHNPGMTNIKTNRISVHS